MHINRSIVNRTVELTWDTLSARLEVGARRCFSTTCCRRYHYRRSRPELLTRATIEVVLFGYFVSESQDSLTQRRRKDILVWRCYLLYTRAIALSIFVKVRFGVSFELLKVGVPEKMACTSTVSQSLLHIGICAYKNRIPPISQHARTKGGRFLDIVAWVNTYVSKCNCDAHTLNTVRQVSLCTRLWILKLGLISVSSVMGYLHSSLSRTM